EVAFWQSIQSSKDVREFEAYLTRYGERGVFSMLAANRVAALRAEGGATRGASEKSDQQLAAEALIRARKMIQDMVANAGSLMGAKDADPTERVNKFRGMLGTVVDFKPMARFVLGKHYESVTPEQWERFFLTYKELFLSGYEFSAAKSWTGKYELETVREYGDDILVTVKFVRQDAAPLRVGFRIRRRPESFFGYKIIDALTDGMSLVTTQRNDFAGVLASGGIEGLIQTLETRFGKAVKPIVIPD
ncbi:MAG: ABC transporter substrate-binding protein, partial [Rhodospirillales bacterium]|nr:ABC transporter substrate-binding protein [Rhodospirillales bacterium]